MVFSTCVDGRETATNESRRTEHKKDAAHGGQEGYPQGGGPNCGLAYLLWQIDSDTLPEGDVWPEVGRRIEAARAGVDGWRTGEISRQSEFGERGECP